MKAVAGLVALLFVLAGCSGSKDGPATTTPSPTPPPSAPAPKQVFLEEGNNAQCTEPLAGESTFKFQMDAAYNQIEVGWHATGIGQVGYAIRDPAGALVVDRADYNPGTPPPCTHQHGPGGDVYAAVAGQYTVTVRNAGVVGWQLVVVARHSASNATHEGHSAE